jgi:hypothetical protein
MIEKDVIQTNKAVEAIDAYLKEYDDRLIPTDSSKIGLAACAFVDKYANIFRALDVQKEVTAA